MAKFIHPNDFVNTFWTVVDGDWYVSTIGNDITGEGTPTKPFLTIHRAFQDAIDGQKIVIGPDEYLRVDGVSSGDNAGTELPCRLATTGHLPSLSGIYTIDDLVTIAGDRILLWNQNDPRENGIFVVSANPWERADDFNNPDNITPGKLVPIIEGTKYGQTIFQFTTNEVIIVGTTNLSFAEAAVKDWGQIQGDIVNQTDLSVVLDAKADVSTLTAHTSDTNNPHSVDQGQVGLDNVDNTSDAGKPISSLQQAALDLKLNNADIINSLLSTDSTKVLSAAQGKILKDLVDNINTLLSSNDTTLDELQEVVDFIKQNKTELDALGISNIAGLQVALDSKADDTTVNAHISNTGNPHSVTKTQLGLSNVDNTSDVNKPISSAQQSALNAKASGITVSSHISNSNNPHSVTQTQIGLSNVDNTSDSAKPISLLQQAALDLKVNNSDIIDSLLSTDSSKILSANQGKILKDFIDNINTLLSSNDTTLDELQEVVDFIKQNKTELDALGITNIAGLQSALDSKADKTNVLEKDNTTTFTPATDFHPSTKKYVDDKFGTAGNVTKDGIPVDDQIGVWAGDGSIEGGDQFTYDKINNQLNIARNSVLPTSIRDSIFQGENHNISVGSDRGWSVVMGEKMEVSAGGVFNNSFMMGFDNKITTNSNIFIAFVLGEKNIITGTGNLGTTRHHISGSLNTIGDELSPIPLNHTAILGHNGWIKGSGSIVLGRGLFNDVSEKTLAAGTQSLNAGINTNAQVVGHGALANQSSIFGGIDSNIPVDSLRSIIVGGNAIKADAATPDTVFLPKIRIGRGTGGAIATGSNENLLVLDGTSGEVKQIPQPTPINVIDNLISNNVSEPLSANQGKVLKDLVDGLVTLSRTVPTFADLPIDGIDQENIFVQDASTDPTVDSGWAIYKSIGAQPGGTYVKVSEQESLDLVQFIDGKGTTVNGNSVDLGGSLTGDVVFTGAGDFIFPQDITFGSGLGATLNTTSGTGLVLAPSNENVIVNGNILPNTQGSRNNGTDGNRWGDVNTVAINGLNFPITDGTNGQALTTNGAGVLSFQSVAGFSVSNESDNRIITSSGTGVGNAEGNLTFNGSALAITGTISASSSAEFTGLTVNSNGATPFVLQTSAGAVPRMLLVNSKSSTTHYIYDNLSASNGSAWTMPAETGILVTRDDSVTLSNKTINLSSNTIVGTMAQFNAAVTDGTFSFGTGFTVTNESDNRIVTSSGAGLGGNAEANLTYDGVRLVAKSSAPDSTSIGASSETGGTEGSAVGYLAICQGDYSVAIGAEAEARETGMIVIGRQAANQPASAGDYGIVIGYDAGEPAGFVPASDYGITIGYQAWTTNPDYGISIGYQAHSVGSSISMGRQASTTVTGSMAFGAFSTSTAQGAIMMGHHTSAQTNFTTDSFMLAWDGTTVLTVGKGLPMELEGATGTPGGTGTINAQGYYVNGVLLTGGGSTFGLVNQIGATNSSVDDFDYYVGFSYEQDVRLIAKGEGADSVSLGALSIATQSQSIAIGRNTKSEAAFSIALGSSSGSTSGSTSSSSISIGNQANSGSSNIGLNSLAIGYNSESTSSTTIAIGASASASNGLAIAIGDRASISGSAAIGIGQLTTAVGGQSIALGNSANASGIISLAIGFQAVTVSGADNSIALGNSAQTDDSDGIAIGHGMHAGEIGSIMMGYHSSTQTNSIANSFELSFGGVSDFKTGIIYGTRVTQNDNPASNLTAAVEGNLAYDTTDSELQIYNGSSWDTISIGAGGGYSVANDTVADRIITTVSAGVGNGEGNFTFATGTGIATISGSTIGQGFFLANGGGSTAFSKITSQNNAGDQIGIESYGSAAPGVIFGINYASTTALTADVPLFIATSSNDVIRIGTNNILSATIDTSQNWDYQDNDLLNIGKLEVGNNTGNRVAIDNGRSTYSNNGTAYSYAGLASSASPTLYTISAPFGHIELQTAASTAISIWRATSTNAKRLDLTPDYTSLGNGGWAFNAIHDVGDSSFIWKSNGTVLATLYGEGNWNFQDNNLTTTGTINALDFNGVALETGGSATNFLNEQGNYVAVGVGGSLIYGTDNQIPVMNGAGTDFEYSANFKFDGTTFRISNSTPNTQITGNAVKILNSSSRETSMYVGRTSEITGLLSPTFYSKSGTNQSTLEIIADVGINTLESIYSMILQSKFDGQETIRKTLAGYNYTTLLWDVDSIGNWNYKGHRAEDVQVVFSNNANPNTLVGFDGLVVYNSTSHEFNAYVNGSWTNLSAGITLQKSGSATDFLNAQGNYVAAGGGGSITVSNQADNRLLTATAVGDALNAESSLTFDGTLLSLSTSNNTVFKIIGTATQSLGYIETSTTFNSSTARAFLVSYSNDSPIISFGEAMADNSSLQSASGKLLIGSSDELLLGTNGIISARVSASTQDWNFQDHNLLGVGSIISSGHIAYQTGVEAKAGNYNMTNADNGKILQVTGNRTLKVPATGISAGWTIMIVNEGTGIVTIDGNTKVINSKGVTNPLLESQWGGCTIYFDGTDFTAIGDLT